MQSWSSFDGISQGYILWQGDHCNAALGERSLHGDFEYAGHLLRLRDQFTVMAALCEQVLRMGLLKIATPDFRTGDLRGDGQDGYAAAVAIVQPVY